METRKNILILSSDAADTLALAPIGFSDAGQTPPEEFLLIRYGENDYTKGEEQGKFAFSEADANEIIADFSKRGKDIVFDYEHQTLKGVEAPASGWIKGIAKGAEGLIAKVDWTERAKKLLSGREYRYHSPVLHFKAGRPYRLHSVALTNHPALHGYPALVADDNKPNKEDTMNEHLKKLAAMLGVTVVALADGKEDEKATAAAVEAKIKALSDAGKGLQELLSLHDCKTADELTLKIKGMVPVAEKQALEAKLAGIEAEKVVAKAFSDGKLIEAQREWAVALAKKDLKAFTDYAEKAPKIAPGPASAVAAANPPKASEGESKVEFSDSQKAIFNKLGYSNEEIEAIKKEAKK